MRVNEHTSSSDAQLLFNVLSLTDNEALVSKKVIFINCTHQTLTGGHLTLIEPEHVVLEVPPEIARGPDALGNLYVASASGKQVPLSAVK